MPQLALPLVAGARSYAIREWNALERSFRVVASTKAALPAQEIDPKTQAVVTFRESLESWDLRRFNKYPIVLRAHQQYSDECIIGLASDVKETDAGLEMKITLASLHANPATSEIEARLKEGLLRGVSVWWSYGDRTDETRNGETVRVYRNNVLNEVSLVPVPADEDALVESDTRSPEQREKDRISGAARALAGARRRSADADEVEMFDFGGTIGKTEVTQIGGLKIPARLTRTGVLVYKRHGRVIRQLRAPEEVFAADSLATLHDAPVTDLAHHTGFLDAASWKEATLGHAKDIRQDGNFVAGDLIVNDAATVADIDSGKLRDISCGYSSKLIWEPGEYNGEHYDCRQTRIRYNHVALLAPGAGRAGTDVSLQLDAACVEMIDATPQQEDDMANEFTKKIIILDGREFEMHSQAHFDAIESAHKTAFEALKTEHKTSLDAVTVNLDKANAKADAAERAKKSYEDDAAKEKSENALRMKRKLRLMRTILRAFEEDPAEPDEDDKMTDAKFDELFDKSDRDLQIEFIKTDERFASFDGKDKSDAYVEATFDMVSGDYKKSVPDRIDSVVLTAEELKRRDATIITDANDPVAGARKRQADKRKTSGLGPLAFTSEK